MPSCLLGTYQQQAQLAFFRTDIPISPSLRTVADPFCAEHDGRHLATCKHSAVSFREAYGKGGCEDDNASGVGYDPPGDDCPDFDLGLTPFPSGFDPGEFRLNGSIGTCFKSPLGLGLHFV